jgi:hypothetical protein
LREQIRSGHARPEQKMAICAEGAPLSPEDRVELLAVLALDSDSDIAERAQSALLSRPTEHFLSACARPDADPRLFAYCADNLPDKKGIADALARNGSCPTANVARIASHLTSAGIQALLDNLERLISDSQLVLAVSASSASTAEQRELLGEMQKGALATHKIEEAAAEVEPDPIKRQTLFQKVAHMNVVQRLTLALKGGRSERMLLIKDPNKLVQRCVLQSPRLTETEVEAFSAMTNLSAEILRTISMTRIFIKSYTIMKNLVNNPKTPLDASLHMFPRLTATDLMKLTANKNIPDTLRSAALKLHRKRKMGG